MVDTLGYGAESRWKDTSSRPVLSPDDWKTLSLSLSLSVKLESFFESGKIKAAKGKNGLRLSLAVPKIQWAAKPC